MTAIGLFAVVGPALASDTHGQIPPVVGGIIDDTLPASAIHVVGSVQSPPILLARAGALKSVKTTFTLPAANVHRPKGGWWMPAADVHIAIAPNSGYGHALIFLSSNGTTWSQIDVFKRHGANGPTVSWRTTLGFAPNYPMHRAASRSFVIPTANFPSLKAVRIGKNTFTYGISEEGNIHISSVAVPLMTIFATSLSPYPLEVHANVAQLGDVHAGETVDLPYTIQNGGPTPLRNVRIQAARAAGVTAKPDTASLPSLAKEHHGVVHVQINRSGNVSFNLVADSANGHGSLTVTLAADPAPPESTWKRQLVIGVGVALAVFVVLTLARWLVLRTRRRPSSPT